MAAVIICSDFGAPKIKSLTVSIVSPSICHEVMGPDARILVSLQFSSVTQLCPTLCDPMNCSMPGLPVHHQLQEFAQTHVHRVGEDFSLLNDEF